MNKKVVNRDVFAEAQKKLLNHNGIERPFITLSYAQTLDGSISICPSLPVKLSNGDTQLLTHKLRSIHDAILIGIGTLLADDPLLTVRLVQGKNPQPIVVDSKLRFPTTARMLKENTLIPWIATTSQADKKKMVHLEEVGMKLFHLSPMENGWVNLRELLHKLYLAGVRSIMIEGGATIISNFLKAKLVDQLVLTVSPMIIGGYRSLGGINNASFYHSLKNISYTSFGDNLVILGDFSEK
jgi:3,4-dihydroxy 2-butanone 4-phosphate synthase/GTP cyclohydrolase II